MVDRDKYRRLFVDEARENLASYTNHLVEFEKQQGKDGDVAAQQKQDAMDACFRAEHSLKGMAASMGYDAFAVLAHNLEDLADKGRQGELLSAEAVDLLLEGGDVLTDMVELLASEREGELNAGDLPARIEPLLGREPAAAASTPAPTPAAPPPVAGAGEVVLVVRFAEDTPLPQVRAFMLRRALLSMDGFVRSAPEGDALKTAPPPDSTVRFYFSESADMDAAIARAEQEQGVVATELEHPAPAPAVDKPTDEASGEEDRTIRVRAALLDEFIDSVGELLLTRSRMRGLAARYGLADLDDLVDEVERLTRELHDRVVAARMTPLSSVTDRLPRVVRDLSRQTGKKVAFDIDVGELELDRAILDELFTPLMHMVRNAVDHGHEGAAARLAAGKDESMSLRLQASRDRDRVLIELSEDGGGIDPAKVKARAIERGLISPEQADEMSDNRLVELVTLPGFSTAESVTSTSGRGVGMDVVKATLKRVGGTLRIVSEVDAGTRMILALPLTVAIIRVLVVEAGDEDRSVFAIPIARVERVFDLAPELVRRVQGRLHLTMGEELVPLFDLSSALGFPASDDEGGTAIVVGDGATHAAFRVAAVIGQEEVVIKPLGRPLARLGYLSGATLLADGRAAYILEPLQLLPTRSGIAGQ